MAHNLPVPEEEQIEQLIVSVYAKLPTAEIGRLNRIEERLARKLLLQKPRHNMNTLPWWVVLLLAGGFATAAWWISESYTDSVQMNNHSSNRLDEQGNGQTNIIPGTGIQQEKDLDEKNENPAEHKESPVIYQREY